MRPKEFDGTFGLLAVMYGVLLVPGKIVVAMNNSETWTPVFPLGITEPQQRKSSCSSDKGNQRAAARTRYRLCDSKQKKIATHPATAKGHFRSKGPDIVAAWPQLKSSLLVAASKLFDLVLLYPRGGSPGGLRLQVTV